MPTKLNKLNIGTKACLALALEQARTLLRSQEYPNSLKHGAK
jgi:hypothetical protein